MDEWDAINDGPYKTLPTNVTYEMIPAKQFLLQ
jgi:hypothetical protein